MVTTEPPEVSIITPVFNNETHLEETLRSVRDQEFTRWEHLLVDDGSTDGSLPLIEQHASEDDRIRRIKRTTGLKGPSASRNLGIRESTAERIIFLDADDLLDPGCLESRMEAWSVYPENDFLVFRMEWFDREPGDVGRGMDRFPDREEECLGLFLRGHHPWQTTSPLWSKAFLEKIGGWDESVVRITDPEIHSRALIQKGVRFRLMKDAPPDCFYRRNEDPQKRDREWLDQTIRGRISYFQRMNQFAADSGQMEIIRGDLSQGIRAFIKQWLLSRSAEYPELIHNFLDWASGASLLDRREQRMLRWASSLWQHDNRVVRMLRIKGLVTRMI